MPQVKPEIETFAKIKVVGVGGSGGSAIDRMVRQGIRGVEFIAMNTDVQALHHNSAPHKLHIGKTITRGLGSGMDPEMGKRSAEESQNEIRELLKETDMVFVTCGLGGGTGSGAAPVIAEIAKDMGALTVGVVTRPFSFEGPQRRAIAEHAHRELARHVDTIITIPNDRVLQIIDKKTSLLEAFKIVDDVLRQGVQGISELITVPGIINVDFADVKTIMRDTGSALMGIGIGSGDNRAVDAANAAISSPLLDLSIDGARGILFTITGGASLGMQEVAEAAKIITNSADDNAKVIFGAVIDESMGDDLRITVIATGFEDSATPIPEREVPRQADDSEALKPKKSLYSSASLFAKKKPTFTPPQELARDEREEEQVSPREQFSRKPIAASIPQMIDEEEEEEEELRPLPPKIVPMPRSIIPPKPPTEPEPKDDLEIPTFIRKKMGM